MFVLFSGSEFIPTLEEALRLCQELELQVYLEVKSGHDRAVAAISDCLKQSPSLYNLVAVISFCPFLLYKVNYSWYRFLTCLINPMEFNILLNFL